MFRRPPSPSAHTPGPQRHTVVGDASRRKRETLSSFNPEPTAKVERAEASVSAGTVGTCIGPLAPDTFAVGSGLNDSVWAARGMVDT